MARLLLNAFAVGASVNSADSHRPISDRVGDGLALLQIQSVPLPDKSVAAPLSDPSATLVAAQLHSNISSSRGTALPNAGVAPSSFAEFVSNMPDRYTHIAYDVEYNTFGEQLTTLPMRKPRTFNVLMATVKTWLADMIVQLAESRGKGTSEGVDWRRSGAFAVFGFFYVGLVQWALYVSVMTELCPNAITFSNEPVFAKLRNFPGLVDLVKQVCIDNFFFAVLIYFPVFYSVKEVLAGSHSPVADALKKYRSNFVSDNMASMAFWIPGDCLAFAAPIFLRLPIDHAVSFFWTMLLSYRRGGACLTAKSKGSLAKAHS